MTDSPWKRKRQEYESKPAPADYVTVSWRCVERQISLTRMGLMQAGKRAVRTYKRIYEAKPAMAPEIVQVKDLGPGELVAQTYVYAYAKTDLGILDEAIDWAREKYGE